MQYLILKHVRWIEFVLVHNIKRGHGLIGRASVLQTEM